jgi:hypothetical protein
MILARANDGATPPATFLPATSDPGMWQPTPPAFGAGTLLHWRNLTPFGLLTSDQFRSEPPPLLSSGRYAKDFEEVKSIGGIDGTNRPQDRADVARFFAAASAAYAWNLALQQASTASGLSLSENARAFALLNMAISDGLVASIETKYHYVFWRPVTAIRDAEADGNAKTESDASWTPLITTPSFPGYPSAHASASYAAREIGEFVLRGRPSAFVLTHAAVAGVTLTYSSFRALTDDIDDARVYGGIHFRFDQEAGGLQGRNVGDYITKHHLGPSLRAQ